MDMFQRHIYFSSFIKAVRVKSSFSVALVLMALLFSLGQANADISDRKDVKAFINEMNKRHQFDKNELSKYFQQATINKKIIKAMRNQAEFVWSWDKYRKHMISRKRINDGVRFMRNNKKILEAAYNKYGVSPYVIVAIMGIETSYGRNQGGHKVFEALSTLAFEYPKERNNYKKRTIFFKKQLEHFLLLSREENTNPLGLIGSSAGALGQPQFMPDSYRDYAVDFDHDGKRDIWKNNADTIGSIANFLSKKGKWKKDNPIATPAYNIKNKTTDLYSRKNRQWHSQSQLESKGIKTDYKINNEQIKVTLHELKVGYRNEYWAAFNNFHSIMSYNPRVFYAMSVFMLSQKIKAEIEG